jgi:hypothetical protein
MRYRTICSLVACAVLLLSSALFGATSRRALAGEASATELVATYFSVVNSMLAGASANGLTSVYAPDAVLTFSTPLGTTKVIRGLPALESWYTAWTKAQAGSHFTRTSISSPLPGMAISYEYTSSLNRPLIGRCAHTFSVSQGKIITDDWVVYFIAK